MKERTEITFDQAKALQSCAWFTRIFLFDNIQEQTKHYQFLCVHPKFESMFIALDMENTQKAVIFNRCQFNAASKFYTGYVPDQGAALSQN